MKSQNETCMKCLLLFLTNINSLSRFVIQEMVKNADDALEKYEEAQSKIVPQEEGVREAMREIVFQAGTSKRIWNELYKVALLFLHEIPFTYAYYQL